MIHYNVKIPPPPNPYSTEDLQVISDYHRDHPLLGNPPSKLDPRTSRTRLLEKYGLTPADYNRILDEQGGGCAICGDLPSRNRSLPVDHDHRTGKTRGILCNACNVALGLLKDNPRLMKRAIEYLSELSNI